MEKLPGPNTQEVHHYKKGVSLEEMKIDKLLHEMETETLSLESSSMPSTSENAAIMVSETVIADLLDAIISQTDASAEYNKMPFLTSDDQVIDNSVKRLSDSDDLNLTLDPHLPVMALSSAFTAEGLPAMPVKLIEKNIVLHQTVSDRMGQYLNKTPNGYMGNFVVNAGKVSKQELIASVDECLEILSFSSLLINNRTLTWSSEIKLAKLYHKGIFIKMIKGGVASGTIKENLANARFSSEVTLFNNIGDSWHGSVGYKGPSHMLIRSGVRIAGE
jgi:predicted Zn-dependent protease